LLLGQDVIQFNVDSISKRPHIYDLIVVPSFELDWLLGKLVDFEFEFVLPALTQQTTPRFLPVELLALTIQQHGLHA